MPDDQKPTPAPRGNETLAQAVDRLGFVVDDEDATVTVTFVGPRGVAAQPKK